jgi:hypothetical protein
MTQTELELMRLRIQLTLVEAVALKTHVLAAIQAGMTLERAVQATLRTVEVDDEIRKSLLSQMKGMDSAEIALRDAELQEIVGRMQAFVLQLEKTLGPKG